MQVNLRISSSTDAATRRWPSTRRRSAPRSPASCASRKRPVAVVTPANAEEGDASPGRDRRHVSGCRTGTAWGRPSSGLRADPARHPTRPRPSVFSSPSPKAHGADADDHDVLRVALRHGGRPVRHVVDGRPDAVRPRPVRPMLGRSWVRARIASAMARHCRTSCSSRALSARSSAVSAARGPCVSIMCCAARTTSQSSSRLALRGRRGVSRSVMAWARRQAGRSLRPLEEAANGSVQRGEVERLFQQRIPLGLAIALDRSGIARDDQHRDRAGLG